jgi:hypothetical protein
MNIKLKRASVAIVAAVVAATGLQVTTAAPAAAISGLVRMPGPTTPDDTLPNKTAQATCPTTAPRIVGGGIVIDDGDQHQVFARTTRPLANRGPNGEDVWEVAASAPPGFLVSYSLRAIAVCAPNSAVPGHQVVHGTMVQNIPGSTTQNSVGSCPTGKRVIGVGGSVFDGGRAVGLSAVRSDGPRGITRAFARDRFGDTDGVWQMQASAICMITNDAREATWAAVPGNTATILCQNGFSVHGPGGGSWTGIGLIHRIEPSADLQQTTVITTPGSTATLVSIICLP